MNTRLQVEHPVTELVTGLDLVAWQLRIASGEALGFAPGGRAAATGTPSRSGSTPRTRAAGASRPRPAPSPRSTAPSGPGVRLDAGYESGDTVSQFYDNLIAKLVVWAPDREAARRRMLRAIDETRDHGRRHHPAGRRGHPDAIPTSSPATHSTKWVEETLDLSGAHGRRPPVAPPPAPEDDGCPTVQRDVTAEVDGRRYQVKLWVPDLGTTAAVGRGAGTAPAPKRPPASAAAGDRLGQVAVPMQGTIVKVLVAVGDKVEVGQTVCVLEAMKMENTVNAEKAASVKEVRVAAGRLGRCRRRHGGHRVGERTGDRLIDRPAAKDAAAAVVDRAPAASWSALSHAVHATPELCFEETRPRPGRGGSAAERGGLRRSTEGVYDLADRVRVATPATASWWWRSAPSTTPCPTWATPAGTTSSPPPPSGPGLALAAWPTSSALTVRVLGTPAEEGGGGKILMLERGAFDDVHAAMMVHPWPTERLTGTCLAVAHFDVHFTGREAHASAAPWEGVNAARCHDDRPGGARPAAPAAAARATRSTGWSPTAARRPTSSPPRVTGRFMARSRTHRGARSPASPGCEACFEAGALGHRAARSSTRSWRPTTRTWRPTRRCWRRYRANAEALGRQLRRRRCRHAAPDVLDRHGQRVAGGPHHPPAHRHRGRRRRQPPARVRRRMHHALGRRRGARRCGGAGLDGHRRRHRPGAARRLLGRMITEHALLQVIPGQRGRVRRAMERAKAIIAASPGLRLAPGGTLHGAAQLVPAPRRVGTPGGPHRGLPRLGRRTRNGGRSCTTSTTPSRWSSTSRRSSPPERREYPAPEGVSQSMTVRATWKRNPVIAESDRTILVEGNQYFPADDVRTTVLEKSETTTHCPWKGDASYYSIVVDGRRNDDAAWYYPEPHDAAKDIQEYVAFWKGVEVSGTNQDTPEIRPPGR